MATGSIAKKGGFNWGYEGKNSQMGDNEPETQDGSGRLAVVRLDNGELTEDVVESEDVDDESGRVEQTR
jgi:hypothetical protein